MDLDTEKKTESEIQARLCIFGMQNRDVEQIHIVLPINLRYKLKYIEFIQTL